MYWKILKINETKDFVLYKYSFECDEMTGEFKIYFNDNKVKDIKLATNSTNFDLRKLIIKIINYHSKNKKWIEQKLIAAG